MTRDMNCSNSRLQYWYVTPFRAFCFISKLGFEFSWVQISIRKSKCVLLFKFNKLNSLNQALKEFSGKIFLVLDFKMHYHIVYSWNKSCFPIKNVENDIDILKSGLKWLAVVYAVLELSLLDIILRENFSFWKLQDMSLSTIITIMF